MLDGKYAPSLFDVVGPVNTTGGGTATIPIHPPIFVGGSPANNAEVTIVASNIWVKAVLVHVQVPDIESDGVMFAGLTLGWREQPSA